MGSSCSRRRELKTLWMEDAAFADSAVRASWASVDASIAGDAPQVPGHARAFDPATFDTLCDRCHFSALRWCQPTLTAIKSTLSVPGIPGDSICRGRAVHP